jgi:predicted PurR-regulated permease PerM
MAQTSTPTIKWWVKGDLNGFFGLFSNVLTNFLAAIGLLLLIGMPTALVFGIVVPGTAIAVSAGGYLAGIPGVLFAVPVVSFSNVVIRYIASGDWRNDPVAKDVPKVVA